MLIGFRWLPLASLDWIGHTLIMISSNRKWQRSYLSEIVHSVVIFVQGISQMRA